MSKHNRGSSDEIERNDWRTPPKLFRAIQEHFGVTCVLDAAADANNSLCPVWLGKEQNTLTMSLDLVEAQFCRGFAKAGGLSTGPAGVWCNPEYHSGEELLDWVDKGANHARACKVPWLFLLPASRSEQPWFHHALTFNPQIAFIKGRVEFLFPDGTPGPAPNHPSLVLAFAAPWRGTQVSSIEQPWVADEKAARRAARLEERRGLRRAAA